MAFWYFFSMIRPQTRVPVSAEIVGSGLLIAFGDANLNAAPESAQLALERQGRRRGRDLISILWEYMHNERVV